MTDTRSQTRASTRRRDPEAQHVSPRAPQRRKHGAAASATTIDMLPHDVLLLIFQQLGFPHRFSAAEVCRQWRGVAGDAAFTCHVTGSINDAIRKAQPGDTLIIPSGFYNETILVDRPLKLVGQQMPNLRGELRRSVTIQSRQHMAVLCDAQTCLEAVTIRTLSGSDNRSIVAFGPACQCISLNNCDLAGSSGVLLPHSKGPETRLVLRHCSIHSVHHPIPAVSIIAGHATLVGCSIYRNDMAIEVLESARISMSNCDVSFNRRALELDGGGFVKDCVFWGNEQLLCWDEGAASTGGAAGANAAPQETGPAAAIPNAAPQEAGPAPADAPAGLAAAAAAVCGIGAASGIVFSGNHVRSNQHSGTAPSGAQQLRRQVRQLSREVYGRYAPDYNDWEILGDTDLDTDVSTEDDEPIYVDLVTSGSSDDGSDGSLSSGGDSDGMLTQSDWSSDSFSDSDSSGSDSSSSDSNSSGAGLPLHQQLLIHGAASDGSSDDEDWDPAAPH